MRIVAKEHPEFISPQPTAIYQAKFDIMIRKEPFNFKIENSIPTRCTLKEGFPLPPLQSQSVCPQTQVDLTCERCRFSSVLHLIIGSPV